MAEPGNSDGLGFTEILAEQPLMTMRVSRDSGQTWGSERAIFNSDDLSPFTAMEWPPCKCPRCSERRGSQNR